MLNIGADDWLTLILAVTFELFVFLSFFSSRTTTTRQVEAGRWISRSLALKRVSSGVCCCRQSRLLLLLLLLLLSAGGSNLWKPSGCFLAPPSAPSLLPARPPPPPPPSVFNGQCRQLSRRHSELKMFLKDRKWNWWWWWWWWWRVWRSWLVLPKPRSRAVGQFELRQLRTEKILQFGKRKTKTGFSDWRWNIDYLFQWSIASLIHLKRNSYLW